MRLFGLIGWPLGHSFSQKYFTEKFAREQIADSQYVTLPLERIDMLPALLAEHPELCGLNVTIPYKEAVIPYLDRLDETAAAIGAVNCIRVRDGELVGYNTDAEGFRQSLLEFLGDERPDALVLGTGGAAKAVVYIMRSIGLNFRMLSRFTSSDTSCMAYGEVTDEVITRNRLIINATPLGMAPDIASAPPLPYHALTPRHFLFDLVYNPPLTQFLKEGAAHGTAIKNGAQMLALQAEAAWAVWDRK